MSMPSEQPERPATADPSLQPMGFPTALGYGADPLGDRQSQSRTTAA